jgi:SecD/SecF fusion protein
MQRFLTALLILTLFHGGDLRAGESRVLLQYEVEPPADAKDQPANIDAVLQAVRERVRSAGIQQTIIQAAGKSAVRIMVVEYEPGLAQRVKRLLASAGTLEFRILANNRDHKAIIERANKEPGGVTKGKTDEGKEVIEAWWVPLYTTDKPADKKRMEPLLSYPEIAQRTVKEGGREVKQVLVVKDSFDVTGAYLSKATTGVDRNGKPCVNFALSAKGGRLFAGLTGANLPEMDDRFTRKLGIILDGRLFSAPSIQSTISDRGEITGAFTKQEVEDLVAVLNAGALPAKLNLIQELVIEKK